MDSKAQRATTDMSVTCQFVSNIHHSIPGEKLINEDIYPEQGVPLVDI